MILAVRKKAILKLEGFFREPKSKKGILLYLQIYVSTGVYSNFRQLFPYFCKIEGNLDSSNEIFGWYIYESIFALYSYVVEKQTCFCDYLMQRVMAEIPNLTAGHG